MRWLQLLCSVLFLSVPMLVATSIIRRPAEAQQARPPAGLGAYFGPHQLVPATPPERRINLVCMGEGSPTVILSAGAAAWSMAWWRVQPQVALKTRVCSWDRAGNGFSDASVERQDIRHIAADLEAALKGAGVSGPLVLVGHSQGGLESLLFADHNGDRVKGLVLVDPAIPDQSERLRAAAPALMAWSEAQDRKSFDRVSACIDDLKSGGTAESCSKLRSNLPEPLRIALRPWDRQPSYWATYLSDFQQRDQNAKLAVNSGRNYGDALLIVLGSGVLNVPGAPPAAAREVHALQLEIKRGHEALAQLSTRGVYVRVEDSGHAIMLQKPAIVEDAIDRVVDDVRSQNR